MANERNAGRKPKFKVPSKKVLIPICIEDKVNELAEEYRFINQLQKLALEKCANESLKSKSDENNL